MKTKNAKNAKATKVAKATNVEMTLAQRTALFAEDAIESTQTYIAANPAKTVAVGVGAGVVVGWWLFS